MGEVRLDTERPALDELAGGAGLLPLPEVDVVDGGDAAEDDAEADDDARDDGRQLVEMDEGEEDHPCGGASETTFELTDKLIKCMSQST